MVQWLRLCPSECRRPGSIPGQGTRSYMPQLKILDATVKGTTQRDGMGREEGGGFRMGNTCIPVADSF